MKKMLLMIALVLGGLASNAQITITHSDMPVSGDTLRWSSANPTIASINLTDTGTSRTWDFTSLTPTAQGVDAYKTALSVNVLYALISFSAYGYKVADSFPGIGSLIPVSITELYTFYEKKSSNTKFSAVAFAAKIAGIPTPFNYTIDDDIFMFPLNYLDYDTSKYSLTIGVTGVGPIKQVGVRRTRVDAWGTIVTPYITTPTNCIRVRSVVDGTDSISAGSLVFAVPRKVVEYKWLINGQHYPALFVTTSITGTTERITSVRYRDVARVITSGVADVQPKLMPVTAYPNPTTGKVHFDVAVQSGLVISLYDVTGRCVATQTGTNELELSGLPAGKYLAQIASQDGVMYASVEKM
jgi:hypothetical protein